MKPSKFRMVEAKQRHMFHLENKNYEMSLLRITQMAQDETSASLFVDSVKREEWISIN